MPTAVSPLLSLRWKRIIVDEGHVVSEHTTNLSSLLSVISFERRWMVSGTPTINLHGMGLGNNISIKTEDLATWDISVEGEEVNYLGSEARWTPQDRVDLAKLASIMVHFLQIDQFASQPRLFARDVCGPLLRNDGPAFGSVQILGQVMGQVMFRHPSVFFNCQMNN
jgi:hypothetical protein